MKYLRDGLGLLLAAAVLLRLLAWLVTPVIPLLIVLFVMVAIFMVLLGGRSRP